QASFTELVENQESIILDLENLYYYSLNAAATLLWKQLRAGTANTVEELATILAKAFKLSQEQAQADSAAFVKTLCENQLIVEGNSKTIGKAPEIPSSQTLGHYEAPVLKTSDSLMEMKLAQVTSTVSNG
ncbi:MAG TPA: PqqD family protein, partial [Blastocatellia bacterium]|nr:PqqD family protein [Blastocatellia bacterium]